jgi:hypothetical protein
MFSKCALDNGDPTFTDYLKVMGKKKATINDIVLYQVTILRK